MDECLPVVLAKPAPGKHESIFNTLLIWPGILLTPLTTPMINFVLKLLHLMPIFGRFIVQNPCIHWLSTDNRNLDASTMDGTIGINNANKRDIHHFNRTVS